MINSISLQNIASYPESQPININLDNKRVNLFYGLNGSGKSTIAKYLQDLACSDYLKCSIYPPQVQKDILVYNQSFVESNFYEKESQQGIFTIGEADANAEKEIESIVAEIQAIDTQIKDIIAKGRNKEKELDKLDNDLKDVIWKKKEQFKNHPLSFCIEQEKRIGTKAGFFDRIQSVKSPLSYSFEELAKEAKELNGVDIQELPNISKLSFSHVSIKYSQILQERIVGESDSYLSQLIEKLGNSDWVRNGLKYSDGDNCPFCQQPLNNELKNNIKDLFSTVYENKISELETLYTSYQNEVNNLKEELNKPIFSMSHITKHDNLFDKLASYTGTLDKNLSLIQKKLSNPSEKIDLIDTKEQLEFVNHQIELIQNEVAAFNQKLRQKDKLFSNIRVRFWQILKDECQPAIDLSNLSKEAINNNLETLKVELKNKNDEKESSEVTLSELRGRTTDIITSVTNINQRLQSLGVTGFSLMASEAGSSLYYIARSDSNNSNIFRSLSEGEKTLITFLYFLEKCSGATSKQENAIRSTRTIVIDDPISSLSQNYIFDIASIIHNEIIERDYKQILILTHNLYFFHELLMLKNPNKTHKPKDYNLYRVIKSDHTNVIPMDRNTLLNDYQNYWQMIKDCSEGNLHVSMLPNAMRNILERYFGFIHQKDHLNKTLDKIGSMDKEFEPLLRYFNRGSHSDSINLDVGTIDTQRYISKFKEIFAETGFPEHFNTMMKSD